MESARRSRNGGRLFHIRVWRHLNPCAWTAVILFFICFFNMFYVVSLSHFSSLLLSWYHSLLFAFLNSSLICHSQSKSIPSFVPFISFHASFSHLSLLWTLILFLSLPFYFQSLRFSLCRSSLVLCSNSVTPCSILTHCKQVSSLTERLSSPIILLFFWKCSPKPFFISLSSLSHIHILVFIS